MQPILPDADPRSLGLSAERLARIDAKLAELISAGQLPGAAILVARRGQVVHHSVQGLKNIAAREPLADDTIFAIFSMTKPVTAAAMMILHEQGLWSPDDPIAKYLPEFAGVRLVGGEAPKHPPTMRELMTHTAGLGYGIGLDKPDPVDAAYLTAGVWKADNLADMARRVASAPLAYQPGERWRYSIAMDIQGAVIERLSGQSLPDFMRSRLFQPLGMVDTDFFVPERKRSRLATLYHMYGTQILTVLNHPNFRRDGIEIPKIPSGGGGLYSTLSDYARFAQMLLNKGELGGVRVLQPASVALMTANHLSDAVIGGGFSVGAQKICPGRGFGFNGAVFYDPAKAGSRVGKGTYQWDGASGVWFWVDPENELIFVGMIQRMMQDGMAPLQALTQELIADALE